ncbi:hypothetical protein CEXT_634001 [Caerostris extrusa]|uniref:Uncharacterized protein n=1 Tax=Caerostris extrusa TaxID=172846 RepID=A0AAV4XWV4_CAEEX|nr:hypothetical protein CEXT_634001 [Caerostris extrusa]
MAHTIELRQKSKNTKFTMTNTKTKEKQTRNWPESGQFSARRINHTGLKIRIRKGVERFIHLLSQRQPQDSPEPPTLGHPPQTINQVKSRGQRGEGAGESQVGDAARPQIRSVFAEAPQNSSSFYLIRTHRRTELQKIKRKNASRSERIIGRMKIAGSVLPI